MPTTLITGANRGIGLEHARQALAAGEAVIATCRRHAQPREIAEVILFLATPAGRWVNGAEIFVDGGLTAALATGVARFPGWA